MWPSAANDDENDVLVASNRRGSYTPKYKNVAQDWNVDIVQNKDDIVQKLATLDEQHERIEESKNIEQNINKTSIDIYNEVINDFTTAFDDLTNLSIQQQTAQALCHSLYCKLHHNNAVSNIFNSQPIVFEIINATNRTLRLIRLPNHSYILKGKSTIIPGGGERLKKLYKSCGIGSIEHFLGQLKVDQRRFTTAFIAAGLSDSSHLITLKSAKEIFDIIQLQQFGGTLKDAEIIFEGISKFGNELNLNTKNKTNERSWKELENCCSVIVIKEPFVETSLFRVHNLSSRSLIGVSSRTWKCEPAISLTSIHIIKEECFEHFIVIVNDKHPYERDLESVCYEYERYMPLKGWGANYLTNETRWLSEFDTPIQGLNVIQPCNGMNFIDETWNITTAPPHDQDGWQYSMQFTNFDNKWTLDGTGLVVRRRRWSRRLEISANDEKEWPKFPDDYSLIGMMAKLSSQTAAFLESEEHDESQWAHLFTTISATLPLTIGIVNASSFDLIFEQIPPDSYLFPPRSLLEAGSHDQLYEALVDNLEDVNTSKEDLLSKFTSPFASKFLNCIAIIQFSSVNDDWLKTNLVHINNLKAKEQKRFFSQIDIIRLDLKTNQGNSILLIKDRDNKLDRITTYENQRWLPFKGYSGAHLLPSERSEYSDINGISREKSSFVLPSSDYLDETWNIEVNKDTDKNGWMYAFNFLSADWSNSNRPSDTVRRRKWYKRLNDPAMTSNIR